MAEDRKNQQTSQASADSGVTEKQALDDSRQHHGHAALKSGYGYRVETYRDENGNRATRKVYFKVGG